MYEMPGYDAWKSQAPPEPRVDAREIARQELCEWAGEVEDYLRRQGDTQGLSLFSYYNDGAGEFALSPTVHATLELHLNLRKDSAGLRLLKEYDAAVAEWQTWQLPKM